MREGTLAHSVLENILLGRAAPSDWKLPKGFKHRDITPEMRAAVDEAVEFITTNYRDGWPGEEKLEGKVDLAHWGLPEVWGTADYRKVRKYDRLVMGDYKHGSGVGVDADCAQLWTYAAGALTPQIREHVGEVELVVLQPRYRNGNFSRHIITVEQLDTWVQEVLIPAIARAQEPNPPAIPSLESCRWCAARENGRCPEYHGVALSTASLEFADLASPTPVLAPQIPEDPQALGQIFQQLPLLKNWIKTIEARVAQATKDGQPTGLKFVNGRGSRKWADEEAVIKYLTEEYEFTAEDYYPELTLLSPAALEKKIPKGKTLLAPFVEQVPGKPTLVPVADTRPGVDTAVTDFADMEMIS